MSSLRDLYAKVEIQDGTTAPLNNINNLINRIVGGLQRLGNGTNSSLNGFNNMNSEVARLSRNLNDSTREIISLNRRLSASESEMQSLRNESQRMERELRGARDEITQMQNRLDQAEREAQQLRQEMQRMAQTSQQANTSVMGIGSTLRGMVGLVGTVFAVDRIKDFAMSGIELAAGTKALSSQFEQVFGDMEKTAATNLNSIAEQTGVLPDRLKGSFVQMAAFAKTTGADTAAAMSLAERATLAAADSAAFYDRGIEDVTDNLQSLLKGNFENDASLGISVTETTRNAAAMKLFNKEYKKLNEEQKQLTLLQMVEDGNKAAGAIGQAARESDGFENVVGNLKSAWDGLKGSMMTPFLDTVTSGLQGLTSKLASIDGEAVGMKMKAGFDLAKDTIMSLKNDTGNVSDLWQKAGFSKENSDTIADFSGLMRTAVVGGIAVAKTAFAGLKTAFQWAMDHKEGIIAVATGLAAGFAAFKAINIGKNIFSLVKGLGSISLLANPVGIAVVAIGGLVAAGVYLYRNWDTVKEKAGILKNNLANAWQQIKDNVSSAIQPIVGYFGSLRDSIVNTWTGIKDGVGNAVSQVVGFFDSAKERAIDLWETIKQNPMLLSVVGPIGMVVGAGMTLAQNWDTIKAKAGELWSTVTEKFASIKQSVSDFVQPAIGWFETLGQKWDSFKSSLANFKMPEWVGNIGGAISGAASKVAGWVNGSHATGLANVPFDGYRAELHKGESVLTADQSDGLRAAGVLSSNGNGTPSLNFSGLKNSLKDSTETEKPLNSVAPALMEPKNETEKPLNYVIPGLTQPQNENQKPLNFAVSGLPRASDESAPIVTNSESHETNHSAISVPVNLSVTVHATQEKAQNIEKRIREVVPNLIQQAISNMIDEDLQTL